MRRLSFIILIGILTVCLITSVSAEEKVIAEFEPQYSSIGRFDDGITVVRSGSEYSFIDSYNRTISDTVPDSTH